jgi:DNA-binding winged helix-turn-helix (wHTH) protein/tetratricopeptide (TPR) repeat protein
MAGLMTSGPTAARQITLGSRTVRPQLREIEGPAGTVRVKPKSMEVFLALLRRPRQLCTRDELLAEVWKDALINEDVLTQAVTQLRRALGDCARSPEIIETVPGRGYRLLVVPRTGAQDGSTRERAAGRLWPFVGRRAEQEALEQALERAGTGDGGLMFLAGEPGIGKTRLAEEVLSAARDRMFLTLVGRCSEEPDATPMLAFVEIVERAARVVPRETFRAALGDAAPAVARMVPSLRREFPDLSPPVELPPEQQRRYLFNAFLEWLERGCESGPVCLLLDDLQWADEATVLLLRHLAWESGRLRLLIIGAFRNTELNDAPVFQRVLAELVRQRIATCLTLQPLTFREVGEFLAQRSGTMPPDSAIGFFVQATDGNPFFVEELYGHLVARRAPGDTPRDWWQGLPLPDTEVPAGVRGMIVRRASQLADATRSYLAVAAVVGRTFDPALVRSLAGPPDDERFLNAVEEAERAGLVTPRPTGRELRYEFTHDVIRHSLLSEISAVRRRQMHLQVVAALEALHPDTDAHATDIISHLEQAGDAADRGKTIRYSMLAAERALEAAAPEGALRHLNRALSMGADQDRRSYARLLFLRGFALRGLLRWEEAFRDWYEAIPLLEELGDVPSLSRACKDLAIMAQWHNNWDEAIAVAERGLALVGQAPTSERANLLCHSGLAQGGARRFDQAERILAEAEAIAREIPDAELLGAVLMYRSACAMFQMRVEDQLALARRSVARLRGTTNLWDFVPALELVHMAWFCLGQWRDMAGSEPEIERMAGRIGHVGTMLFLHHARAWRLLLESGHLEDFGAGASVRLEASTSAGFSWARSQSRLQLGQVAWWRGNAADAEAHFQAARSLERAGPLSGEAVAAHLLLRAHQGDQAALDLLAAHEDLLPEAGRPAGIGAWKLLLAAVESLALVGRLDRAAELHSLVLHAMQATGARMPLWSSTSLSRVAGISAAASRRWDEANAHFDQAQDECERLPNLIERPAVLGWRAWMLRRRNGPGDRKRAAALVAESRAGFARLGIDPRLFEPGASRARS